MDLGALISFTNWLYMLLLFFAFAAIPAIPAAILRVKAPVASYKILAATGTAAGLFCLLVIMLSGNENLEENEMLATFAQCALLSTVPVLYCAAFVGIGKQIWIAVAPSVTYFLSFFIRHLMTAGFWAALNDILGGVMVIALGMTAIFFIWALVCIFVTKIIYRLAKWIEDKINEKSTDKFGRRIKRKK